MHVLAIIRRGRKAAKDQKDPKGLKDQQADPKNPPAKYWHVPTHAASDALLGAPSGWKTREDATRIREQNRRRSTMGSMAALTSPSHTASLSAPASAANSRPGTSRSTLSPMHSSIIHNYNYGGGASTSASTSTGTGTGTGTPSTTNGISNRGNSVSQGQWQRSNSSLSQVSYPDGAGQNPIVHMSHSFNSLDAALLSGGAGGSRLPGPGMAAPTDSAASASPAPAGTQPSSTRRGSGQERRALARAAGSSSSSTSLHSRGSSSNTSLSEHPHELEDPLPTLTVKGKGKERC